MRRGQYRVTGTIGRGGMGAVYAGEHTLLGRPAAIKVLLPELSQKQDVVMRFFNEARAATAIRHPGIIEIYDFGWTADGAAFIVMEHLEGETLARRAARTRLRWPAALAIARQTAGALSAAHAKGIVHCDLKPVGLAGGGALVAAGAALYWWGHTHDRPAEKLSLALMVSGGAAGLALSGMLP